MKAKEFGEKLAALNTIHKEKKDTFELIKKEAPTYIVGNLKLEVIDGVRLYVGKHHNMNSSMHVDTFDPSTIESLAKAVSELKETKLPQYSERYKKANEEFEEAKNNLEEHLKQRPKYKPEGCRTLAEVNDKGFIVMSSCEYSTGDREGHLLGLSEWIKTVV
jgi:hypothetical protein